MKASIAGAILDTLPFTGDQLAPCTGALAGRADLVASVRSMHNVLGGTVDPFAAYLLLRGMKTLGIRVKQQNRTAQDIAQRLEAHPLVDRVRSIAHSPPTAVLGVRRF